MAVQCHVNAWLLINTENFGFTSLKEDTRSDFLGHVVMNFEWNKLHDCESWSGTHFIVLTHIIAVGNIENIELSVTDLLPCGIENTCGMNGTFTAKLLKVFILYRRIR